MSGSILRKTIIGMPTLLVLAFCISGCRTDDAQQARTSKSIEYQSLNGKTMGTTYQLTFKDDHSLVKKDQIDKLLVDINQGVSTYISDSDISLFNQAEGEIILPTASNGSKNMSSDGMLNDNYVFEHMVNNLMASRHIYDLSSQLFDPTIMPLVNYWGFGYKGRKPHEFVKSDTINQILSSIGLGKISTINSQNQVIIKKSNPHTELDFSAIAKGYGVDLVLEYLRQCNVTNAYVEIGGEVSAIGKSPSGQDWKIGINTPDKQAPLNDFEQIIQFSGLALASSGNYRNFHEVNGKSYGHEINPKTGYPEQTDVLSASVIAPTCQLADGLATACMVMGSDASIKLIDSLDGVEVLLITSGEDSNYQHLMSSGFKQYLVE